MNIPGTQLGTDIGIPISSLWADIQQELGALWFDYVTRDGHKDRDCHFIIEQYFSYGDAPYWTAYHAGYVDDGFGVAAEGARKERRFGTYNQAIRYCVEQTIEMFRRHHKRLPADTVERLCAIATEAQRAETLKDGSVHDGAGPKDIAQNQSGNQSHV